VSWIGMALFMHRLAATSAERAALIQELQAAKQALELAREREAELAALRERERLARELHDNLGHALVTLSVQLEAVQRLAVADSSRVPALVDEMKRLVRGSMEDLRRSLANLRSPGLGERRLTDALRDCCEKVSARAAIKITQALDRRADELPERLREVLWRVGHEGLANVERHSHAKSAAISLGVEARSVCLRVQDDGIGLSDGQENKPGHYGLRGARERIEGLGGKLVVARGGTRGTVIEVSLPLMN
jgi:signal transduction histidine kinase